MKRVALSFALVAACTSRATVPPPTYPLVATSRTTFPVRPALPVVESELELPQVASYRLANGLRVLAVEQHRAHTVSLAYVALQGAESGPVSQLGWSALATRATNEVIRQPHGPADVDTLASGSNYLASWLAVETTAERLNERLTQLVAALVDHDLSTAALSSAVDEQLDDVHREVYSQGELARRHAHQILYGDDHPLGQSVNGSLESLQPLTLGGLRERHAVAFAPEHSALIVVGDFESAQLQAQLTSRFASLPATGRTLARAATIEAQSESRARGLLTGGRTAYVVESFPAPAATHADYAAFRLLGAVSSELWGSRLMHALRERAAKTYSVNGALQPASDGGTYDISLQVAPEDLLQALRTIDTELAALRDTTVNASELGVAKLKLREELAESLERADNMCGRLISFYSLLGERFGADPNQILRDELAKIDAVSAEQVRDVARRYFTPERRAVAVAGPLLEFEFELTRWYGRGVDFFVPSRLKRYF